jgi:hypothetical protein
MESRKEKETSPSVIPTGGEIPFSYIGMIYIELVEFFVIKTLHICINTANNIKNYSHHDDES